MNQGRNDREDRASGDGFIAALDQSGGSTPKALQGLRHRGGRVVQRRGDVRPHPPDARADHHFALLRQRQGHRRDPVRADDGRRGRRQADAAGADRPGVVPFIKIDKGLEAEENGVQLMKPMPELDALLERAKGLGVFGTKERSVINSANAAGIAVAVAQQFQVAKQVLAHGMMPIIEPEVNIKSADRARKRRPPARRDPRRARRASRRPAGDAQAVDPCEGRPVRAAGRSPQGAARGRACPAASAARRPAASLPRTPA